MGPRVSRHRHAPSRRASRASAHRSRRPRPRPRSRASIATALALRSASLAAMATEPPASAKAVAMPRPMPRFPPVTTATLPCSENRSSTVMTILSSRLSACGLTGIVDWSSHDTGTRDRRWHPVPLFGGRRTIDPDEARRPCAVGRRRQHRRSRPHASRHDVRTGAMDGGTTRHECRAKGGTGAQQDEAVRRGGHDA